MAGICCYGSAHPTLVHSLKSDFHKKRVLSLQCRSTASTNNNSKKPNPNPTPQLLKLAVTGLTELLRIFSSGNGRLDTEYSVQENEVPVSNIDDVVMTLKLDYENSYFVTGIFTSAIYLEDCLFEDPTIKFRGKRLIMLMANFARQMRVTNLMENFYIELAFDRNRDKTNMSSVDHVSHVGSSGGMEVGSPSGMDVGSPHVEGALTAFRKAINECRNWQVMFISLRSNLSGKVDGFIWSGVAHYNKLTGGLNIYWTNILMDCNSETSFVSATWKLRTFLRLPWRPLISVNGSTVYELDDNFRIVRHAESWDISALQAIGQIFTPSFLAHWE
ncbi:hypothetical protein RHMOL_Rhmol07G0223800 [Rhododendron molle]|uniref:Uncharacterized protein n=1 Tax=Rhododendron molle TaxID=49168 RepID=A0ACC0N3G4_RHOML|nr:hypothetical protein RHMOL_Rhmol07G0223800 [Rhododendron molle]